MDEVANAIATMEGRQAQGLAAYRAARAAGMLYGDRGIVVASWRCKPRGCLLLDVYRVPDAGLFSYLPPFRQSPERNAGTDADARATRTTDGQRRWAESADVLLPDDLEYWLNCDHLAEYVVTGRQARIEATRRAGTIIAAPDVR